MKITPSTALTDAGCEPERKPAQDRSLCGPMARQGFTYGILIAKARRPARFPMPLSPSLWLCAATPAGAEEFPMLDVIMLVLGVGAFALLIGYVALCERL